MRKSAPETAACGRLVLCVSTSEGANIRTNIDT